MITLNVKRLGILVCMSIGGATLLGGFMFFGTLLPGHVRAMGMEFGYTLPWALIGLAVGAVSGLVLDLMRSSRNV